MSQPNKHDQNPGRKAWRDGSLDPKSGDFEQYAARGRELLNSSEEADDLLAELDQALDEAVMLPELSPDDGVNSVDPPPTLKIRPISRRQWMAIAASMLLVISLAWWMVSDRSNLLNKHYVHYESNASVRTLGNPSATAEGDFEAAIEAYDLEDYPRAIANLEVYYTTHPNDGRAVFFLGLSYLGNDQAKDALPLLDQARINTALGDAPDFYWALAAKSLGQTVAANTTLYALSEGNGLFAQRAKALLEE